MARERGVHVVSLGDFLNYLGYKPQKRLIAPADSARNNAQPGSARPTISNDNSKRPKALAAPAKVFPAIVGI